MASASPSVGQTVSHYKITGQLGAGGMGVVYRAKDLTLGREVALKFPPAELVSDPGAKQRLVKEAQAASRLNHPHIATIYEVGESEGLPFIAMELVEGQSLRDALAHGPLDHSRMLDVARQIAEGLGEAHRAGVFHRDIKPRNIMLDAKGRVKILDFGLAVLTGRERGTGENEETFISRTATQFSTGGTVPYMSPEQLRGDATDARSDIFSYGVLLYECLAGRLPFPGETSIDVMAAILRKPPVPLASLAPDASPAWRQLVERCLAKAPADRPRSMEDILETFNQMAAPAAEKRPEKSLAVLYFENPGGNKDDEYFRDGITEDIITELSRIQDLWVFTRSAVAAFRDKPTTAQQVGQQLGATHVLEGSLRRLGDRLRVTARLVETRTSRSLWAERYDRQLEDVFAIQDEIAQNLAKAMKLMLTEQEKRAIARGQTADVQAYDYYLRGRQFFYQFSRKGFDFARQMFARATVIDPNYARAYAGIADCCSFLYMYYEATEANVKEADAASRRALEIDPESAEAHASRGLASLLNKRYEEAEKEFDTSIQLNPKLFEAYYFRARACVSQGKMEEALKWFQEAVRVNPEDYQAPNFVASTFESLGKTAEALTANRRALEVCERHLELHPEDSRALYLGAGTLARLGRKEQALEWLRRSLSIDPDDVSVLYNAACCYALIGQTEEAIDCLEKTLVGGEWYKGWAEHDTDLDSLRGNPRFQAMMKSL